MKKILVSFIALSVVLLQGCGFHLRGQYIFVDEMQPTYLDIDNKEFKFELQDILEFGNLTITDDIESAKAIVQFIREDYDRETVSLDGSGQASRYLLSYTVEYRVVNEKGDLLLEETTNSTTRTLDYDPNRQLQTDSEEAELVTEIIKDLSNVVARRLAKVTGEVISEDAQNSRF